MSSCSVRPYVNFNAKHDAEVLHKAMKGIGTNEDTILMLLISRSNDQRQQIKSAYKKAYGKCGGGLFFRLGWGCPCCLMLGAPVVVLLAPVWGAGTDDQVLIEILASRSGEQIKEIIKVYKKEFGGKLEKDICGDTDGHYRKLLVILLQGSREEGIDEDNIENDAKELFAAGEGKFGTDEEKFITILGNRSAEHLQRVFAAYKTLSGSNIEDSIKSETTGNLENLLLAVGKNFCVINPCFCSLARAGTDDDTLTRVMVSRSEVDLLDIKASFKKMYGASLYSTIQEDTNGYYQKTLLYLCGGND
uniref:Annexin n=1 Tax=Oryzias melastigma TaxID=30732 RepID=A0A3B3BA21_ORYME